MSDNNPQPPSSVIIQFSYNNCIYSISVNSHDLTIKNFIDKVSTMVPIRNNVKLHYEDEESETITMSTDTELQTAIQDQQNLLVYITDFTDNDSNSEDSEDFVLVSSENSPNNKEKKQTDNLNKPEEVKEVQLEATSSTDNTIVNNSIASSPTISQSSSQEAKAADSVDTLSPDSKQTAATTFVAQSLVTAIASIATPIFPTIPTVPTVPTITTIANSTVTCRGPCRSANIINKLRLASTQLTPVCNSFISKANSVSKSLSNSERLNVFRSKLSNKWITVSEKVSEKMKHTAEKHPILQRIHQRVHTTASNWFTTQSLLLLYAILLNYTLYRITNWRKVGKKVIKFIAIAAILFVITSFLCRSHNKQQMNEYINTSSTLLIQTQEQLERVQRELAHEKSKNILLRENQSEMCTDIASSMDSYICPFEEIVDNCNIIASKIKLRSIMEYSNLHGFTQYDALNQIVTEKEEIIRRLQLQFFRTKDYYTEEMEKLEKYIKHIEPLLQQERTINEQLTQKLFQYEHKDIKNNNNDNNNNDKNSNNNNNNKYTNCNNNNNNNNPNPPQQEETVPSKSKKPSNFHETIRNFVRDTKQTIKEETKDLKQIMKSVGQQIQESAKSLKTELLAGNIKNKAKNAWSKAWHKIGLW